MPITKSCIECQNLFQAIGTQVCCNSACTKLYHKHSHKYMIGEMYDSIVSRCKRYNRQVEFSKKQLKDWLISNPKFRKLRSAWIESGHVRRMKPTIDRIDGDEGYTWGNIQILTMYENQRKASTERAFQESERKVVWIKRGTEVHQFPMFKTAKAFIGGGDITQALKNNGLTMGWRVSLDGINFTGTN